MAITKTYSIGLSTNNEVVAVVKIDAVSIKEAEEVGKDIKDAITPILEVHYGQKLRLKTTITHS